MELPVTYQKETVGRLTVTQQGLYYRFEADCTVTCTEPLRLFAVCGFNSKPIGVLSREGSLNKRISVREAGKLPSYAVLGKTDAGYFPWCGVIDGETVADAYLKGEGAQMTLALPVSDGMEVPLIGFAAQMTPAAVCGRECLQLPLEDGRPVQPEAELQSETELPALPPEEYDLPFFKTTQEL